MKCTIGLTEAEKKTLQELSRRHRHEDFRLRGLGILLLGSGRPVLEVAQELEVSCKTIYNWSHAWREQGLCGLLIGHKGGRPRALSEAMIATAVQAASAESMTLKQIALRIEADHGTPLPCRLETLSVALRREGFSYKRGRYSLKKSEIRRSSP